MGLDERSEALTDPLIVLVGCGVSKDLPDVKILVAQLLDRGIVVS